jgi:hypothetical protein
MRFDTEPMWVFDDEPEPSVMVDPSLPAFCIPRWRGAKGTQPPRVEREISVVDGTPLEIAVEVYTRHHQ